MKPKVVINRSKWRCGGSAKHNHGSGGTMLLNTEGYMCCLGFASLQLCSELTEKDILDKPEPSCCHLPIPFLTKAVENELSSTTFCVDAMEMNDDHHITLESKEEDLTDLFFDNGIDLVFEGEYES